MPPRSTRKRKTTDESESANSSSGLQDYSKLTVAAERTLSTQGAKADLVNRLQDHDKGSLIGGLNADTSQPSPSAAAVANSTTEDSAGMDLDSKEDQDYESQTVAQLRAIAKRRGLSDKGKKAELVERLRGPPSVPSSETAHKTTQKKQRVSASVEENTNSVAAAAASTVAAPSSSTASSSSSSNVSPLMRFLTKPPGTWTCSACDLDNPPDKTACRACETANPAAAPQSAGQEQQSAAAMFTFGV